MPVVAVCNFSGSTICYAAANGRVRPRSGHSFEGSTTQPERPAPVCAVPTWAFYSVILTINGIRKSNDDFIEGRAELAQEFTRLGFADILSNDARFRSLEFLTEELTTSEVQSVLSVVPEYNSFNGPKVAAAIEQFRGRVKGWKFGRAGSPLLIVAFAHSTHQLEEVLPKSRSGTRISQAEAESLIGEMRKVFIDVLDADKFEPDGAGGNNFGAWWD